MGSRNYVACQVCHACPQIFQGLAWAFLAGAPT
jgi:hypothetical protein